MTSSNCWSHRVDNYYGILFKGKTSTSDSELLNCNKLLIVCVCVCANMCFVLICVQLCFFPGSWIDMTRGEFELNWREIAQEWAMEGGGAPSRAKEKLMRALSRAFPGLREIKEKAKKDGNEYLRRVFMAPVDVMNREFHNFTSELGAVFTGV